MAQVIICDEPLSGVGIGSAIDQDTHQVVDTIRSIEEAQRVFVDHQVDVAIVDPRGENGARFEVVRWIAEHHPRCAIILVSGTTSDELLVEAGNLHVKAVVPKTLPVSEFSRTVDKVARGEVILDKATLAAARTRLTQRGMSELATLNDVDREILCAIASGRTDREIAGIVYLSPQTVRNRVSRLLGKLGRENRTQLALMLRDYDDVRGLFRAPNMGA